MHIDEKQLTHWIDHFYGYGSWEAKLWFIGPEEGGGDLPDEVVEKLDYFHKHHASDNTATLCDFHALFQQVAFQIEGPRAERFSNLHDYRFGDHAVLHGTWKNLIAFAHGYRGKKLPDLLDYQKTSFALPAKKQEALIKLYPLPAHNHAWYYSWLDLSSKFSFLRTRSLYQEHLFGQRIQAILEKLRTHRPAVVLMYGMSNINALKESVQLFFPAVKFKMVKAVKLKVPQHHIGNLEGTTLLLTTQIPSLRHNRIETGFDWEYLGKMVKDANA